MVGLGPGHIVLHWHPAPPPQSGTAPNFRPIPVAAKWLNGLRCHLVCRARPRPRRLFVRWGPSPPSSKRKRSPHPQFSAHVYCGQTAGWIKMTLGIKVGLGPGHILLNGDSAPQKRHNPQFSAHFYGVQTAVYIRIPLGTKVGVSLGDIVLDRDPALPPPIFGHCPLWPNGWMD